MFIVRKEKRASLFRRTLTKGLLSTGFIPHPGSHTGAVDRVPLRARRGSSAQRGLKIRGLKRERRKWARNKSEDQIFTNVELSSFW